MLSKSVKILWCLLIGYWGATALSAQTAKASLYQKFEQLSTGRINCILQKEGYFWAGTEAGLYRMTTNRLVSQPLFPDSKVMAIANAPGTNRIWLSTYQGEIWQLNKQANATELRIDLQARFPDIIDHHIIIKQLVFGPKEQLWMVSDRGDLLIYHKEGDSLSIAKSFSFVNTIFLDQHKNWWIGAKDGLYQLDKTGNNRSQLLSKTEIVNIEKCGQSIFVTGIKKERSVIYTYQPLSKKWATLPLSGKLKKSRIRAISCGVENSIWMASHFVAKQKKRRRWVTKGPLQPIPVTVLHPIHSRDALWVGTAGAGLYIYEKPDSQFTDKVEFQNRMIDLGENYELDNLLFEQDDSTLMQESIHILDELAGILSFHQDLEVFIEGHTSIGEEKSKLLELSLARARAVRNYLLSTGISAGNIKIKGFGASRLKRKDHPQSNQNKRVEIALRLHDN